MSVISTSELEAMIRTGSVKTVICAMPDIWGRLVGKRLAAKSFMACLNAEEGIHASAYLFCVDMDMQPRPGYRVSSWEKGYQDCVMKPDLATIRLLNWLPETAFVLCDAVDEGSGDLLPIAPRAILKHQIERAYRFNLSFKCASELEFFTFRNSYDEAWQKRYRELTPTSRYRADYHILQSTRDEQIIGGICAAMTAAGIEIENAKTEWGLGQQEITLRYADALEMADRHIMYKAWVKEIVSMRGMSATFMAKPFIDEIGSSCHIHISTWNPESGEPTGFDKKRPGNMSVQFGSFVGGMIEGGSDYTWLYAPFINSYKRYRKESFAPVHFVLGQDNRTCGFRLVGHDSMSFRVESRLPGADANPYLALAGIIASGLDGIEAGLATPPIYVGNAYGDETLSRVPSTMQAAVAAFANSGKVRVAFGGEVHDHLINFAENELKGFEQECVTDWESMRYFERA